jgi:hypothetical protein
MQVRDVSDKPDKTHRSLVQTVVFAGQLLVCRRRPANVPSTCNNPVLLIRVAGALHWIGTGTGPANSAKSGYQDPAPEGVP